MRLTIIRADNVVLVDGRALHVDLTLLPANLHAVQWDGDAGHIEYNDGTPNTQVSQAEYDALIAPALAAWEVAREAADTPPPPPDPALVRRAEIMRELETLDMQSVRPLRAKLAGTATAEDDAYLAAIEAQAQALRTELEGLPPAQTPLPEQ